MLILLNPVLAEQYIGGLVGYINSKSIINNSYASVNEFYFDEEDLLTPTKLCFGGLVGDYQNGFNFLNNFAANNSMSISPMYQNANYRTIYVFLYNNNTFTLDSTSYSPGINLQSPTKTIEELISPILNWDR